MESDYNRADIYDLEYKDYDRDLTFYKYMAATFTAGGRSKILEVGCGTGRLSIPLAAQGFNVTGVDISYPMIQRAKEKWDDYRISGRLKLILGNMLNLPVQKSTYSLAIIPFNGFMHLLTKDDQHKCLESVRRSLKDKGFFLAEIGIPDITQGSETYEAFRIFEEERIMLCRKIVLSADPGTQVVKRVFFYKVFKLDGDRSEMESFWEPRDYLYVFPLQWEELLNSAGFNIIKKYGGFDFCEFESGSKVMLYVCQKA